MKTKKVQGTGSSQRARSVQYQWFKDFNWLTLCETSGKLYCTQCRCCASKGLGINKHMEPAFTIHGFQNWKNAILTLVTSKPEDQQRDANKTTNFSFFSFLDGQGLAIDGNNPQCSNLYKLMQLRAEDCPDIKWWLKEKNYMRHDIVNEMIHLT
ncbi:hypothetical protein N1851_033917 [Merluccius polli]|uniref:Uncharacterized protein n=1 Tax=Merluccius polli TaxID=89951 RepID=A0AA47M0S3_MERPO|nr:hypothetical protein N1851_033917 [Merluccius polli]